MNIISYTTEELIKDTTSSGVVIKIEKLYCICFPNWKKDLADKKHDYGNEFLNYTNGRYRNAIWMCLYDGPDKKLVGIITIGYDEKVETSHIYNGCIHPDYRTKGYGLRLFKKCLDFIFNKDIGENFHSLRVSTQLDQSMTKERIDKHFVTFSEYHIQYTWDNIVEIYPHQTVYKLLTTSEWGLAKEEGIFHGSVLDIRDGYIHMSPKALLRDTVAKYYSNDPNIWVLDINTANLPSDSLRWEPARNGKLFPHLYTHLNLASHVQMSTLFASWYWKSHLPPFD